MITVNGESRTLEKPVTVTEYLEACNYVPVQVVVELNEEIIKRDTYDTTVLKDGDVVEILQFMGGEAADVAIEIKLGIYTTAVTDR